MNRPAAFWLSRLRAACALSFALLLFLLAGPVPARAGTFTFTWGTAPNTWTAGSTGPATYTVTDPFGFQVTLRMSITRIGGTAVAGYPDDLTGEMGPAGVTSLQLKWDANAGAGSVGQSTNTATLELLDGSSPISVNNLAFKVHDIDSTDNNNSTDSVDYVTITGNAGKPTMVGTTSGKTFIDVSTASALIVRSNYVFSNFGNTVASPPGSTNGTLSLIYNVPTHTSTLAFDEAATTIGGGGKTNAVVRGIGIWESLTFDVNNTLSLTRSASAASYSAAGQVITFNYTVTNNGPLSLASTQNVVVQDSLVGTFTCGSIGAGVASGASVTCTQTYTVTAADLASVSGLNSTAIAGVGLIGAPLTNRLQSSSSMINLVNTSAPTIGAVNDDLTGSSIDSASGGTTASVLSNDGLRGAPATSSNVLVSLVSNGGITSASISAAGIITVPALTTAGNYTLSYKICETSLPSNCSTATAQLRVAISFATSGGTSCIGTNLLSNGGFESPFIGAGSQAQVSSVPGWTTTDSSIEIWGSGFNSVPSHTGIQFGEINATIAGTLTTVAAVTGRTELDVYWVHRARTGTDVGLLTVKEGATTLATRSFSAGTTAWVNNAALAVTSLSATSASLNFTAVSTGSGDPSVGNFLDTVEVCQTYMTLTKTELSRTDTDSNGLDSAGDIITYRYAISNPSGNNRAIYTLAIVDDKLGTINVSAPGSGDTNANAKLDPGETWIVTAPQVLTAAHLSAGSLINTAYVTGVTDFASLQSNSSKVTATFSAQQPGLSVLKSSALQKKPGNSVAGKAETGDTIVYTYVTTNTGNVAINNVKVTDVHSGSGPFPTPAGETVTDNAPTGDSSDTTANNGIWSTLGPGDKVTYTSTYVVTQTDVNNQ